MNCETRTLLFGEKPTILTVIQISFRRLLHNRVELLLTHRLLLFSAFCLDSWWWFRRDNPKNQSRRFDSSVCSSRQAMTCSENRTVCVSSEKVPAERPEQQWTCEIVNATMAIILRTDSSKLAAELMADASDQVASQMVSRWSIGFMLSEAENQAPQLTEDDQDSEHGSALPWSVVKWQANPSALKSHYSLKSKSLM